MDIRFVVMLASTLASKSSEVYKNRRRMELDCGSGSQFWDIVCGNVVHIVLSDVPGYGPSPEFQCICHWVDWFIASVFLSRLIEKFGCRFVCMLGSILTSLGYILSYFASHVVYMCLSFGVLAGTHRLASTTLSNLMNLHWPPLHIPVLFKIAVIVFKLSWRNKILSLFPRESRTVSFYKLSGKRVKEVEREAKT
ncbi:hypothetical protein HELRODRAFT_180055 [Helobdella robusta]|uniref:Uncharacterized protein n=1 Tax=Helobdella robusta TaxID=6412 RepID=T1FFE9_HELRO|nr:hypothetical protein HELRODRAFT_180055 [Helobdella robusta]ESN94726.1 hypothetical protein HELRODRAFT_180055 [Helobdella robusta]